MDVLTAIQTRTSTRRYSDQVLAAKDIKRLIDIAAGVERLCDPGVRVAQVDGRERAARILARTVGLYGLVEGATHLLVGLLPARTHHARLDLGYVLEHAVLEATRLGLASCWITGTYHPGEAASEVEMSEGEAVAGTVALGYARGDRMASIHDGAVRRLLGAHRRFPLERIVFAGRWGESWSPESADPTLVDLLEHARLAPSAKNSQPWRFVVRPGEIALVLRRKQPIDGGIVMAHIALVAKEMGWPGGWTVRWGDDELADALGLPGSVIPVGTFPVDAG
jgi:nitroreductase